MSYLGNTAGRRTRQVFVFKPTTAGNVFSGVDISGQVLKFAPSPQATTVYVNGFALAPEDWTADAAGTTLTIARNITSGDILVAVAESSYGVADVLKQSSNLGDLGNRDTALMNLWKPTVMGRFSRNVGTETLINNTNHGIYAGLNATIFAVGGVAINSVYIQVPHTAYYRVVNRAYLNGAVGIGGARLGIIINDSTATAGDPFIHVSSNSAVGSYESSAIMLLNAGDRLCYRVTMGDFIAHSAVGHTEVFVEQIKRTA